MIRANMLAMIMYLGKGETTIDGPKKPQTRPSARIEGNDTHFIHAFMLLNWNASSLPLRPPFSWQGTFPGRLKCRLLSFSTWS